MGVKKFFKAFKLAAAPAGNIFGPNSILRDKVVAIDMMLFLCKSIKAAGLAMMSDSAGVPMAGLNTMLTTLPKFKAAGVRRLVAIFDNPRPNPMKEAECKKRDARGRSGPSIDAVVIEDTKRFLMLFGVDCHIAPFGREAEQYAADLSKIGLIDIIISEDSDTLMFGAKEMLTMGAAKSKEYTIWSLPRLLSSYGITFEEFQKICISLGTDFSEKTPGVGPATALTRGKNKPLDDDQKIAMKYISSPDPCEPPTIIPGRPDIEALVEWLVSQKGFNSIRTAKRLGVSAPH